MVFSISLKEDYAFEVENLPMMHGLECAKDHFWNFL